MVGAPAQLSLDQAPTEGMATAKPAGDARETRARLGPQCTGAADRPTKAAPGCCGA